MSNTQQTLAQLIRAKHPGAYDDMDDATLEKNVLAKYPQYSDLPRTSAASQPEGFWHSFSAFLPGYHEDDPLGALKDLVSGTKTLAMHPGESAKLLYHGVTDPMQQTTEAGLARMKQPGIGNKVAGAAEYLEGGIPIVGPALAKAGHQFESGNVAGGAGTMTGLVAPGLVPEGIEAGSSAINRLTTAPKTAAGLYESALKPSTTLAPAVRAQRIQAGLQNEIPVSAAGVDKLNSLVADLQKQVSGTIASKPGATISAQDVAARLNATKAKFTNQVNPEADLASIEASKQEFLRNQPSDIPVGQAQSLKTGTYQQLKGNAYGQMKPAAIEAQKALARGIKEELEAQFPEIKDMNAKEGALIGLDKSLERAVNRIGNWEQIGIGTPIAAGAGAAVTGSTPVGVAAGVMAAVLRNPILKSKLAISLARKGIPLNAANARIGAYTAALASAGTRGGQTSGQEGSE